MNKFNGKNDRNKKFDNNKGERQNNQFKKPKPRFTKIKVEIADSDFYATNLDSLYNLLCSISFDKVAIPVNISKAELFGNPQLKGTTQFGTIEKFNNDNSFTISCAENVAEKFDGHVMGIRCKKDFETGEITYVSAFNLIKGTSVQNNYDDVEQAMLNAADESTDESAE